MIAYTATIEKFDKLKDKTGWSYVVISASQAKKIHPGSRSGFRVRGSLDSLKMDQVAVIPMGDGSYILPVNATMRKALGKKHGDKVKVVLEEDQRKQQLSSDFMTSLEDDPQAMEFFKTLPPSHQQYFSKWIEGARTTETKTKRIVMSVIALSKRMGYGEMIRASRKA